MDTISSAKFRQVYAKLTEPVVVTVNGHPIGEWIPANHRPSVVVHDVVTIGGKGSTQTTTERTSVIAAPSLEERFNSRPFTPVPKR